MTHHAWGTKYAHVGVNRWHLRIGFFDRVALIFGLAGSYWVVGAMYDQEESALLIGVPGLVLGVNL